MRWGTAFRVFCAVQVLSAWLSGISDCDETFNYWEPTHYLLFGFGQQTWEYSPAFGLRSWLYVGAHALVARVAAAALFLDPAASKLTLFYLVRFALAAFAALGQTQLFWTARARFGPHVGRNVFVILLLSPGFFFAGPAFLPSSFCMTLVALATAEWLRDRHGRALTLGAVATVLGWPFVGALFVPVAADSLWRHGLRRNVTWLAGIAAGTVGPELAASWLATGRVSLPALQIVLYNVLSGHDGANLYGREPWTFYALNGLLNFNVAFVLALLAPLLHLPQLVRVPQFRAMALKLWAPLYLWLAIMLTQEHKEERFLFPVYPLVALAAAMGLDGVRLALVRAAPAAMTVRSAHVSTVLVWAALAVFGLASLSRTAAVVRGYGAPMAVWAAGLAGVERGNVCVAREWYRFPSSFFLPTPDVHLRYVRSDFRGQLPQPFLPFPDGLRASPAGFNDQNREEMSRYVSLQECDYFVDFSSASLPSSLPSPPSPEGHEVVARGRFLDAPASPSPHRALYIPGVSDEKVVWGEYAVYRL